MLPPLLNLFCLLGPYCFCPLSRPSLHDMPLISLIFLKRSLVFHILLFSSFPFIVLLRADMHIQICIYRCVYTHHIFFSPCCSVSLHIQLGVSLPLSFLNSSLRSSPMCKASSYSHFAFLHFFFFGMVLVPVRCYKLPSIVLQAVSTRSNLLNLFITSTV